SAFQVRWAARTHSSGPTPAGSPGTSARRGRAMSAPGGGVADADVDVGLAAHFAQVAVPLVLELALADRLAHLGAPVLVVDAGLAAAHALDDVPAGLGPERRRDLAVLQRRDLAAELGAELVLGEPAQVAAVLAAQGVIGTFLRHRLEIGTAGDAGAQRFDPRPGLAVARGAFGRTHQDVAGVVLGHHGTGPGALAHVDQLQQLEPAGAADRPDHLARRHRADRVGEGHRHLVQGPPAQVAAFERVGAVGVAHRGGGEVHLATVEQALDAVDLLLANRDLFGRRALGQGHGDVRELVLGRAGAGGQGGVDLGVADADPALGKALAQALDQDLVAQRGAEVLDRHALACELLAQLVGRKVVLLGDRADRGIDLGIAHAHPGLGRARGLQLHQDQALEHLALEHLARRELVPTVGV